MSAVMDRHINCRVCQSDFLFTAEEQAFYQEKGFQDPRKCKHCRDEAKHQRYDSQERSGEFHRPQQRELHDAVCSACGVATKVPFAPKGTKPIYCRDCYQATLAYS
jgi:CxxC-x17-CxxC domain-containing protein